MNIKAERGKMSVVLIIALSIIINGQVFAQESIGDIKSGGDRLLKKGLYDSVSAMLIQESDMVKDAERRETASPSGYTDKPSAIQNLMYSGLDDVLDEKFEEAIPKLEKVLEEDPTYLSVWSTLGWTYWRVDRIDDAIKLWKKFLVLDEDNALPHELLGNAYVGTSDLVKAETHLKRSIELNPTSVDSRLVMGQIYRWTGRYDASINILKELLSESPDRLDIQNELAMSLYENSEYQAALPLLEQGVKADPDNKELAIAHMRCLLYTGNLSEAELRAKHELKDSDKPDFDFVLLLADTPRYKNSPAESVEFLEKMLKETDDKKIQCKIRRRLITSYVRLWEVDSEEYPLDDSIKHAKKLVEDDTDHMSAKQTLSELLLMDARYVRSENALKGMLKHGNTNSYRAHLGLSEVYQATKQFKNAEKSFKNAGNFNPKNPYFNALVARMEMSRANLKGAYDAIDKLEAVGSQGAVAVLLYRGLSVSDWASLISVRRFRMHLLELKQAGFKFITPDEIHQYFADKEPPPKDLDDYTPERVVIVTFDNPTPKTLELATEIAKDFKIKFAANLSVGLINEANEDDTGWKLLRKYAKSGHWAFGSLLNKSARLGIVNEEGLLGSTLANRVWVVADEVYETEAEYSKRLRDEYSESRKVLREQLGKEHMVNFMAYPHGDIGQGDRSNVKDAIKQNIYEAGINYEVGFVESEFGYAVNGDNPLLYSRYAPELLDTGDDVVSHILTSHPVNLARKLRIEMSTLDGRLQRATHNLKLLRRDNYPEEKYDELYAFLYDHLPMRFSVKGYSEKASRSEFDLDLSVPFIGAEFDWFRDTLNRRNWHARYKMGLNITQALAGEFRVGDGEYRQRYEDSFADGNLPDMTDREYIKVKEKFIGGRLSLRHEPKKDKRSAIGLVVGVEKHYYTGDADFEEWNYMGEIALRPKLPINMRFTFDHDVIPSAYSVSQEVAYDKYGYNGVYELRDWWFLHNNFGYFDINDGNGRAHAEIASMWELNEEMGIKAGISYDYVDAKHKKEDYWTPYRLNEWWLVGKLNKNINEFYYDLTLKIGIAREDNRPEEDIAYLELVDLANRLQFDPGDAPDNDWVDVLSASLSMRKNIGRHWQSYCELLYNEAPGYHEYSALAGIRLIF